MFDANLSVYIIFEGFLDKYIKVSLNRPVVYVCHFELSTLEIMNAGRIFLD
jgi:hypothetical protein